jgi:hypothetical protein
VAVLNSHPEKASGKRRSKRNLGPSAKRVSLSTEVSSSPEEGAELIRAFLHIKQKEVREAIIEFVVRLSERF